MKRVSRIFRLMLRAISTLLFAATAVLAVRGFFITDEMISQRVFDDGGKLKTKEVTFASNALSLAIEVREQRFLFAQPGDKNAKTRPNFLPKDSGEEAARKDFPEGEYFSHNAYGMNDKRPRFPARFGFLGFFWEREFSDPPWDPRVDLKEWSTTQYLSVMNVKGHTFVCEYDKTVMAIPWWFLALGFAAGPAIGLYRRLKRG